MLTYDQALVLIAQQSKRFRRRSEIVDFKSSLGRVLAGPVQAGFDLPRFNNSAVDGYGVLVEDLALASPEQAVRLTLDGELAAGQTNVNELQPGHCLRILTGAPVPESVEAVVMKEFCRLEGDDVLVSGTARIGENIRMQGEEIEAGASVLGQGMLISPPIIGLLATLGQTEVEVFGQPRFAVVATGDELVEPGQPLLDGQIYNSNSYALTAALQGLGVTAVDARHTRDDRDETRKTLAAAIESSDVIITLGGVSVGERDYVKEIFAELGVQTIFWRVAIKPGKPVYFGLIENTDQSGTACVTKLIFGLPGNPVSALVTFHLFVKPALKILQGLNEKQARITTARLARNLKKKGGRLEFVRAVLQTGADGSLVASATTGQESHMLTGLAAADCLMLFDADLDFLAEGTTLAVQLIDWHE